jgi:hypothetical protein
VKTAEVRHVALAGVRRRRAHGNDTSRSMGRAGENPDPGCPTARCKLN